VKFASRPTGTSPFYMPREGLAVSRVPRAFFRRKKERRRKEGKKKEEREKKKEMASVGSKTVAPYFASGGEFPHAARTIEEGIDSYDSGTRR